MRPSRSAASPRSPGTQRSDGPHRRTAAGGSAGYDSPAQRNCRPRAAYLQGYGTAVNGRQGGTGISDQHWLGNSSPPVVSKLWKEDDGCRPLRRRHADADPSGVVLVYTSTLDHDARGQGRRHRRRSARDERYPSPSVARFRIADIDVTPVVRRLRRCGGRRPHAPTHRRCRGRRANRGAVGDPSRNVSARPARGRRSGRRSERDSWGVVTRFDNLYASAATFEFEPSGPIRITRGVTPPRRIAYVQPVYPSIAQQNRITGRVVIEAIIGPTGEVQSMRVVQSVHLLDQAALEAVRQWKFTRRRC